MPGLLSQIEAILECPVCFHPYSDTRRPVSLVPCGHCLCLPCKQALILRPGQGPTECPSCRAAFRSDLSPVNLPLLELANLLLGPGPGSRPVLAPAGPATANGSGSGAPTAGHAAQSTLAVAVVAPARPVAELPGSAAVPGTSSRSAVTTRRVPSYRWVLHDYRALVKRTAVGDYIEGDVFPYGGCTWRLVLYPKEHTQKMGIFLQLVDLGSPTRKGVEVAYSARMVCHKRSGEGWESEDCTNIFTTKKGGDNTWGFDNFYHLAQALDPNRGMLDGDGAITFEFSIRIVKFV